MRPRVLALAIVGLAAWCGVARAGDSGVPRRDRTYVAALSGEMPGAFRDVARHSWVVANVKEGSGRHRHRRYEWLGDASATDSDNPFDYLLEVPDQGIVSSEPWPRALSSVVALRSTVLGLKPRCRLVAASSPAKTA